MARKSPSRLEMRRQAEAAEAEEKSSPKKKATKKKKATRKKKSAKADVRRRLVWGVFTGSMKEESRFPYDQRDAAEERIEQLRAKNAKKLYFIQPVKEPVDGEAVVAKIPVDDTADLDDDTLNSDDTDDEDVDATDDSDDSDDLDDVDLDDSDDGDDVEESDDDLEEDLD
ncbi:hypothetical protein [Gimesia chilikensis]|uniref:Uncharacterized protein n=1 Tax=Gimesia chilikensis TaxID=2605989 RepID=A0A517PXF8_9PLAN|nr:hypothetical protein [Gimesia chilikensis]MBN69674.1 hypothetical protein [Gimesia sp.]MCR9229852.1 hypothetical protein [bacterium]QDT24067.1 hypothetical protein HG66A1_58930 [Gimesia chilikensis]QDT87858.1 hypothetical protein MalM14_55470 [Gimesia chilikensis]